MDFYKIIKTIVKEELNVTSKDEINTDKFFNAEIPENLFTNDNLCNDDYIINRKRKRDFYASQKTNSEINPDINCPKKHNLYPSVNIDNDNVCITCSKKNECGDVTYVCAPCNFIICKDCFIIPKKSLTLEKITLLYIIELYKNDKSFKNIVVNKTILKDNVINNLFLKKSQKDIFLRIYSKAVKYFKSLHFFARYCKQKKAINYEIDCDLFLNSFNELPSSILANLYIQKTNTFYRFRISDLIGVIENALTHSPDIFIEPYFPRNPYTNCEFTKAELYNIYFLIKNSSFVMSQLFHNFFLVNFDMEQFIIMNDDLLREIAVTNYGNHMCNEELMTEFEHMEDICQRYMPRISAGFDRLEVALSITFNCTNNILIIKMFVTCRSNLIDYYDL